MRAREQPTQLGVWDIACAMVTTACAMVLIGVEHVLGWVERMAREWRLALAKNPF